MKIIKVIYIVLVLITLMSSFFMINCSAEEPKFGFSLDIYDNRGEKIDSSEDIILALNIVNNYDYWVAIGGERDKKPEFRIDINDEDVDYYNNFFADEMFMEPKSELILYIPFDYYNKMEPNDRVRTWQLKSKLTLNGFKLYEKPYQSEAISIFPNEIPSTNNPIIGNVLEFTTKTTDVELTTTDGKNIISDLINFFDNWLFKGLLIVVIGGILLDYLLKKLK